MGDPTWTNPVTNVDISGDVQPPEIRNVLQKSLERFQENVRHVQDLAGFDELVLVFAIRNLKDALKVVSKHGLPAAIQKVEQALDQLEKIRINESLTLQYKHMLNQCVVLLVSYFEAAVREVFEKCLVSFLKAGFPKKADTARSELKVSVEEIREISLGNTDRVADMLICAKGISFQDMKSIHRAFDTLGGLRLEKDVNVDTIIFGQACRHVIAHNGGIVNERLENQVSQAPLSSLSKPLVRDEQLWFEAAEIPILGNTMIAYIERLVCGLCGLTDDEIAIVEGVPE